MFENVIGTPYGNLNSLEFHMEMPLEFHMEMSLKCHIYV